MEEARGETFLWNKLKENFIKDFKFIPEDDQLVEVTKKIKTFIKLIVSNVSTETQNQPNSSCDNIQLTKIPHSKRLWIETEHTNGKRFQWKSDHPETTRPIETKLKVETTEKEDPERLTSKYFPPSFSQFKEGSRQINESKAP